MKYGLGSFVFWMDDFKQRHLAIVTGEYGDGKRDLQVLRNGPAQLEWHPGVLPGGEKNQWAAGEYVGLSVEYGNTDTSGPVGECAASGEEITGAWVRYTDSKSDFVKTYAYDYDPEHFKVMAGLKTEKPKVAAG